MRGPMLGGPGQGGDQKPPSAGGAGLVASCQRVDQKPSAVGGAGDMFSTGRRNVGVPLPPPMPILCRNVRYPSASRLVNAGSILPSTCRCVGSSNPLNVGSANNPFTSAID